MLKKMSDFGYKFDRFLRFAELTHLLQSYEAAYPKICSLHSYGKSHQGRDLWMVTITDSSTGSHDKKPAHWVDANIHSVETTAGVAACYLIHHLLTGYAEENPRVVEAVKTRTFYIVPRVNPDGVEAALADSPNFQRSSVRNWPWRDGHRFPGLEPSDIDGDGRVLTMRIEDPHGAWVAHPEDGRVMIPFDHPTSPYQQAIPRSVKRYRLLKEGTISDYDGFTIPTPPSRTSLDLNRNFPALWGKTVKGSGDHPLSEPEIDCLVRALAARPNVCGYNAYHTNGGILLRPSSVRADSDMPPLDVWAWKEMGAKGTSLSTFPVYNCFEDFTWDKADTMSGAGDDFAYEHLGVFSWTTEFWDVIHAATGSRASTKIWYLGPTVEQQLAVAKWADANAPDSYVAWYPFEHPQLGPVEIGGPDDFHLYLNPPNHLLAKEVAPHAEFAVYQALLSPKLEILQFSAESLGPFSGFDEEDASSNLSIWRVRAGVANTGFFPTNVSEMAMKIKAVLDVAVELSSPSGISIRFLPGESKGSKVTVGQLAGRISTRVNWSGSDGTPDRVMVTWLVVAAAETTLSVTASHQRAGSDSRLLKLGKE